MIRFSFINMDIQSVSNPYKSVFNIVVANRCYVAYFMCIVVRYTATVVFRYTSLTGYTLLKCQK